jgi:hypothetical protein
LDPRTGDRPSLRSRTGSPVSGRATRPVPLRKPRIDPKSRTIHIREPGPSRLALLRTNPSKIGTFTHPPNDSINILSTIYCTMQDVQQGPRPGAPQRAAHDNHTTRPGGSPPDREGRRDGVARRGRQARPRPLTAPPVTREWPPSPRPVPWGPLAVTATVFLVVLLLFLPDTGGVCSTLTIVVLGYVAFNIVATVVADFWSNRPRRQQKIEGRARLYRDVAERCMRATERYPFAGDSLRRV